MSLNETLKNDTYGRILCMLCTVKSSSVCSLSEPLSTWQDRRGEWAGQVVNTRFSLDFLSRCFFFSLVWVQLIPRAYVSGRTIAGATPS